ncbi:MAG: EAL domain-containing protein [Burkholderiaceae bacterium]|nr:EAL domain-containing protein [Burkholderiaceae bacterium]
MINLDQAVEAIVCNLGLDPGEIEQRRAFLEIGESDIALVRQLHACLQPLQAGLSAALTRHLLNFEPLRQCLNDPLVVQNLQVAQTIYFDLLTAGEYGPEYVKSRMQVGIVAHRVRLEPKWTIGAYRKYLAELIPVLFGQGLDPAALQATCAALLKIACLDLTFAVDTYLAEERREILAIKNYAEQIVAGMPSGLMIVDAKLGVRSMNPAMRAFFELAASADSAADDPEPGLIGPLAELTACADLVTAVAHVLETGVDRRNLLLALPTADGGVRHIEFTISASLLKEQGVVLLMAQEVTDALHSQEELRHFRMALDSSIDAVYLIDYAHMRFIDANETALATLGYSRAELAHMGPQDLKPDEGELRRIHRRFEKVIQSDHKTGILRTTHRRKDGTRLPVEVYLRAFQSEGRQLLVAVARDITDRLKTEADLRKSEQSFRVAFNQAAVGLAHVAPDGRWLMVNQKLCEILGYTQEELLARNYKDLTHPEDLLVGLELERRMRNQEMNEASHEKRYLHKNGRYVWVNLTSSVVRDENGKPRYYSSVVEDISRRKQMEGELLHMANYDVLTSLPNRALLLDRLSQAIAFANRSGDRVAVLLIDLDRFKNVNDSLGHDIGDKLITGIARKLLAQVREVDTVARLGGDEFVILLPNVVHEDAVAMLAQQVLESLSQPMIIQGHELYPAGSIGISLFPKDGSDGQTLIKNADTAMYRAKEAGRNNFQFYAHAMNARALDRLKLEGGLRHALLRDEFVLHYQPQMDIASGAIVGVEALLRWQPPRQEMIFPGDFIPIAEETGLIVPIGEWVLRTACAQHTAWEKAALFPPIKMAVNLSARQFKQQDIVKMVSRALQETGCDPSSLELEITESIVMENPEAAAATLQQLADMGVCLSIDDFGTGYSSLSYLKRFPIHTLKIDRSFVRDIDSDADDAAIAKAVIALAHSMKLKVIAEGVETVEQLEFLRQQACDQMQGYYLSRPLAAPQLETLLRDYRPPAGVK